MPETLTGTRTLLRPVDARDVDILLAWENDPAIRAVGIPGPAYTRGDIEAFVAGEAAGFAANGQQRFMIEAAGVPGLPVGTADLFGYDARGRRAEVGILIAASRHRRRGYATDALRVLSRYAFTKLYIKQLHCSISEDNPASAALFERLGFVRVGRREALPQAGLRRPAELLYQLLSGAS